MDYALGTREDEKDRICCRLDRWTAASTNFSRIVTQCQSVHRAQHRQSERMENKCVIIRGTGLSVCLATHGDGVGVLLSEPRTVLSSLFLGQAVGVIDERSHSTTAQHSVTAMTKTLDARLTVLDAVAKASEVGASCSTSNRFDTHTWRLQPLCSQVCSEMHKRLQVAPMP